MNRIAQHVAGLSRALDLRVQRHQVLAANIANADTPNFKAQDLDFKAAMHKAMGGKAADGALALATTASNHLEAVGAGVPAGLQYRTETQSAVDGNTVDMDVERVQMAENAMHYEILTRLISDKFSGLRAAMGSNQG